MNKTGLEALAAASDHLPVVADYRLPAILEGDYNGSGQVDQADLDLALLHWGVPGYPIPTAWADDLPIGSIDEEELDKVLLNWGAVSPAIGAASVPESETWVMVLITVAAIATSSRRYYAMSGAVGY